MAGSATGCPATAPGMFGVGASCCYRYGGGGGGGWYGGGSGYDAGAGGGSSYISTGTFLFATNGTNVGDGRAMVAYSDLSPTPVPTFVPTGPSVAPTAVPTAPTAKPTTRPTLAPSRCPTIAPTTSPTFYTNVVSNSYVFTGNYEEFVVPAWVTAITVTLYGAKGGDSYYAGGNTIAYGGWGAAISAVVPVTPGETLRI